MFRGLLALFFVFLPAVVWAQTAPPPDTKPARERHRIQEKEPPPPEGPWGPEEVGLTWQNPVWRGVIGTVGVYSGASLGLDLPQGLAARSDGINPPVFEQLEYHGGSFRTTSGTVTADVDMFRLALTWYDGTFDARATLTYDDGVQAPQSRDLDVHGKLHGFRLGSYWPALRYRDSLLEASVGPAASVGWMHGEASGIPGTLLTRDTFDILTGSFGPRASLRVLPGRWCFELNAEYSFLAGSARGWTKEFSAGVGYKF